MTLSPLRVLVVEDCVDDFELIVLELTRIGYAPEALRVDTAEAMTAALGQRRWDVVISDWTMPRFSGLDALRLLQRTNLDLPFLFASGTVGEETAVEALRSGAHDFFVKDRLARLGAAIERERRDARARAERLRIHEQLMIADRMASVGILAAGVAHEINNPLAAVIANLDVALAELDSARDDPGMLDRIQQELDDARTASDRVRRIVRDLRVFSRNVDEKPTSVDVHAVLESTIRMASNEIRHRARLVRDFGSVPLVFASEGRLGQVCLNLLVNAAQALPEGMASNHEIRLRTRSHGDHVSIAVTDTGAGIPATVMQSLFAPFVTTKTAEHGTGLGLSICHRIVTELGGEIRVDSSSTGTTIEVILLAAADISPTITTLPVPIAVPARRGRILAIDDDPMMLRAIERVVGRVHALVAVSSAAAGLALIRDGERFDVILCDLMMPDKTGMDVHAELERTAGDQADAMIFLTGGAFTTAARAFLDHVDNPRVDKPFASNVLLEAINAQLDR